ncbi:MAG: glutamate racemase, partial [Chloroflexota bacterium]
MADPRPIGVFDSGVGGLTVLREILRRLPAESTVYLGDNARAPYGTRSDDEVRQFSTEALDRLVREDVKALV